MKLQSALVFSAGYSQVVELTKATFDTFLKENNVSLVEYYAPWCSFCKEMAADYEEAARKLENITKLARVNCDVEIEICRRFMVDRYPTLKVFHDGEPYVYTGERLYPSIIEVMTRQVSPIVTMLTQETLQKFKDSNPVAVIMETHINSPEYDEFHKVASKLHYSYLFGMVESPAAKLTIFKRFDEGIDEFQGALNEFEISRFLSLNGQPLIPIVGPNNYEDLFSKGLPLPHFYYLTEDQKKSFSSKLEAIASKFKGEFQFVYLDASKFPGVVNAHGLVPPFPALAIVDGKAGTVYYHKRGSPFSTDGLFEFLRDFKLGLIKPSLKSDPKPVKNDAPVFIVVGSTFEEIVMDKRKDVLIVFHSPSCIYCRRMEEAYNQLGKEIKSKDILIAKINGVTNETPVIIDGFPTILLFKASTNERITYNGDRTVESFKAFLKEYALFGSQIGDAAQYVKVDGPSTPPNFADRFDHVEL